jgi:branched-chain amino acid transport system permease protein
VLIIVNVVFFQQGILGWMQEKWPEKFGLVVEEDPVEEPARGAAAE